MPKKTHKFSLIENSHSFMVEAIRKAISARDDVAQWPFAILHLVQALELSLKELLRRQHPLFIYENIDSPRNTVTLSQAILRLENPAIAGLTIPQGEKQRITTAVQLRNKIIHFEFELIEEYAMAKFSELFAFIVYFQGRYLKLEAEDYLPQELIESVIDIEKCFSELKSKALQRIEEEDISSEWVWACPNCGEDTFVVEDDRNVCFLCRHSAEVAECPQCGNFCFADELEDFSDKIDTVYEEGQVFIHNNYGYSKYKACPDCIDKVIDNIEKQRAEEYYHMMEQEEWYHRKHK